jgi:hypothetical protein
VYASAIKRGSDRAWYIDADQNGTTFNFVGYTLDAFVTLASPFPVGDPLVGMNGIGPFNSLTAVGEYDGIYTFTDQGKSVPLSRALDSLHSSLNGAQFADPGFGWNYYNAITGLRAHTFTGVDNPVGIGPGQRNFTGHNGLATALYAALGELLALTCSVLLNREAASPAAAAHRPASCVAFSAQTCCAPSAPASARRARSSSSAASRSLPASHRMPPRPTAALSAAQRAGLSA